MKLKEYYEYLSNIINEHPNSLELEVIYSSDYEGNSYQRVYNNPVLVKADLKKSYITNVDFLEGQIKVGQANTILIN